MLNPRGTTAQDDEGRPEPIPSMDFGGTGLPLHFLHANGYPPACYRPLIERLVERYHVFGMLLRPLWPEADPRAIRDWKPFSSDLITYLTGVEGGPVIGLGHSIGAMVTLRGALERPGLFRALILIEPVLLPPSRVLQLRVAHALGIRLGGKRLVEGALRRRRHFDSLEQLFAGYRRREIFQHFGDAELRALVEGITRRSVDGGYELVYSPEWEARIYETAIWNDWSLWQGISKLKVPALFLRGADTDTFFVRTAEIIRQRNPAVRVATIPDSTHLVPMERPQAVFEAARDFLSSLGLR